MVTDTAILEEFHFNVYIHYHDELIWNTEVDI